MRPAWPPSVIDESSGTGAGRGSVNLFGNATRGKPWTLDSIRARLASGKRAFISPLRIADVRLQAPTMLKWLNDP